jgi:hypothetical protein
MDKHQHPLHFQEVQNLMNLFLSDVIDEYRDQEIKEWLQGLTAVEIKQIIDRPGHESLKENTFIIPFTYLHYGVVPNTTILADFFTWLKQSAIFPDGNDVINKTLLNFDRIFKGKTAYIFDTNNGGHKSY